MDARPALDFTTIVVGDMAASVAFYERLGLDFGEAPPPPWETIHRSTTTDAADLDLDAAAFAPKWCEGWPAGRTGVMLSFRVPERDGVDRLHAALTGAGAPSLQDPVDAFWGSRFAVVEDPDGNAIALMSPMEEVYASAPPDPPD